MNERELNLKCISDEFARWEVQIANLNSLNLYDTNTISESTICELLNEVYGYQLVNVNSKVKNHIAIDLVDNINRIAYQVTSTKSSSKVQSTIDKFIKKELYTSYDELYILILGKKQKKYPDFKNNKFSFRPDQHILDFRDILHFVSFLPSRKINKVYQVLSNETRVVKPVKSKNRATQLKRNIALKKKMKKELLREIDSKYWEKAMYEPAIRFRYRNIIVRSVVNDTFPNDHDDEDRISNWFKGEFWNFYDNGIEFIGMGGKAIFDKDGHWDLLERCDDNREKKKEYTVVEYWSFYRIPYDYIVELDMEVDQYYGLPALYVEYAKDGMPYEEILPGTIGIHERRQVRQHFEKEMRRKLV